ncbi:hypothetical protein BH23BAC1_BH23BAC1_39180 [soil metagenome]
MTKSTICFKIFLFFISPLFAQEVINAGNFMVGGGIGVEFSNDTRTEDADFNRKSNSFFFSPYMGKFIQNRLLVGAQLHFGTSTGNYQESYGSEIFFNERSSNSFGIGIFLRKYFPLNEKLGAFFQPGIHYRFNNSGHTTNQSSSNVEWLDKEDINTNTVFADINLGLYYFLGKRLSIETTLGNLSLERSSSNLEREHIYNDDVSHQKINNNRFGLNLINQLSFDKIFVINYFF